MLLVHGPHPPAGPHQFTDNNRRLWSPPETQNCPLWVATLPPRGGFAARGRIRCSRRARCAPSGLLRSPHHARPRRDSPPRGGFAASRVHAGGDAITSQCVPASSLRTLRAAPLAASRGRALSPEVRVPVEEGAPKRMNVIVPAARNGPNGICFFRPASPTAMTAMPTMAPYKKPANNPPSTLAPAEPAEVQAEDEREPHVAEAHATRRDHVHDEEEGRTRRPPRPATVRMRSSRVRTAATERQERTRRSRPGR